jgi:hypothetical protein
LVDLHNRDQPSWAGVRHHQPRKSEIERLDGQTIFENHILFGMRSLDSSFLQAQIVDLNYDRNGSVRTSDSPESGWTMNGTRANACPVPCPPPSTESSDREWNRLLAGPVVETLP